MALDFDIQLGKCQSDGVCCEWIDGGNMDVASPVTVRSFRFLCALGYMRSVSYSGIAIRNWPVVYQVPFRTGLTLS